MLGRVKPAVVVGFGGYPTVPPLLAASLRGIPTVLHEQNGVMGRANRLLASRVTAIATGFRTLKNLDPRLQEQDHLHRQSGAPRSDRGGGDALCRAGGGRKTAPAGVRRQPGRAGDGRDRAGGDRAHRRRPARALSRRAAGARRGPRRGARDLCAARRRRRMRAVLFRSAGAHGRRPSGRSSRSGASTVAELSAIGRPAILVPLPHSLDQDQFVNAGVLAGGRRRDPHRAARLHPRAAGRRDRGSWPATRGGLPAWRRPPNRPARIDAAERLADLVLKVAGGPA